MKQRHGFTLLELLVVIAIMMVLMALLLPALSKMRKKGKEQLNDVQKRSIVSAVSAYRLRYHKWPTLVHDLEAGQDETYGAGANGNQVVFCRLEFPPDGQESDPDVGEAVIDMNDFGRRDSDDNVLNPYGNAFQITLDLNEDYSPSGGVSVD